MTHPNEGLEDFYLTISSDNNSNIFPDNKVSEFRVQFQSPIYIKDNSFKVGLASFYYPYDFANIPENSFVKIKYQNETREVFFPAWFCENIEDFCLFLNSVVNKTIHEIDGNNSKRKKEPGDTDSIFFQTKVGDFNRITMTCTKSDFDIAFSDSLLHILGMYNSHFHTENFENRFIIHQFLLSLSDSNKKFTTEQNNQFIYGHLKTLKLKKDMSMFSMYNDFLKILGISNNDLENRINIVDKKLNTFSKNKENQIFELTKHSDYWYLLITEKEFNETYDIVKNEKNSEISSIQQIIFLTILRKITNELLLKTSYSAESSFSMNPYEIINIYSDLIKPEPFNSIMSPILAIIRTEGKPGTMSTYSPANIQYKKLNKNDISFFKILIAGDDGKRVPFLRGPAKVTLHFIPNK